MFNFADLEFEAVKELSGVGAEYRFANGYGISVVRNEMSYGGRGGLYELAVLDAQGGLCYDTPVTNDVIGWLTPEDVTKYGREVSALSKARQEEAE